MEQTNSFFPYTIVEWNKLDLDIRKSKSYAIFRNPLLNIGRPKQCSVYRIRNPVGLKLLTRLRLGLSHLNELNLIIIFRDVLTLYVVVALQLNQPHIFYCTIIVSKIFTQLKFLGGITNLSVLVIVIWSKYYYLEVKIILD